MEQVTFVVVCKKFFGQRPGQTLKDFSEELKALTQTNRADLIAMFPSVGFLVLGE